MEEHGLKVNMDKTNVIDNGKKMQDRMWQGRGS